MTVSPPRTGWRRLPFRLIIALLVALVLALTFAQAPWEAVGNAVMASNPLWLVLAMASNVLIYPFWVTQWRLLASPSVRLSFRRMFNVVALSAMGTAAMSSLVGATSAVLLLVARGGMTTMAATALILVDQILVGLAKLTLLALALTLAPLPGYAAQAGMVLATATFGGLGAFLLVAYFAPRRVDLSGGEGVVAWLRVNLARLAESLDVLRRPGLAGATYLLALAKKATSVGAAYAIARASGIDADPTLPVLVVAAVSLTTAVPLVPGSLGVYSATVFVVYQFLGYPAPVALAAGILQHLCELAPPVLIGYGTVILTRFSARRHDP